MHAYVAWRVNSLAYEPEWDRTINLLISEPPMSLQIHNPISISSKNACSSTMALNTGRGGVRSEVGQQGK